MFILSPDQSFLSSFFRQLSPSGIPPSFHSSSHTVLLSSSPPLPPPFLDPLIRLMYTGRGKSNKGVGGIRAIRREISSNVELRSLLSLPALILFVKRCRGSRASKIPFRGVWRWRGRGRKEKTNITLGNSTIFLSWSREPNIVHTIFERGRERELLRSILSVHPLRYRDRLNYSLGFIRTGSFGRDSCESGVKKSRGGRGTITMERGRGMHLWFKRTFDVNLTCPSRVFIPCTVEGKF